MANIWDNDDVDWARKYVEDTVAQGIGLTKDMVFVPTDWNLPLSDYRKWAEGGMTSGQQLDTALANVDTFNRYLGHQMAVRDSAKSKYEFDQESARKQAEIDQREQLIKTQQNLSNTTEAVGHMQIENRPDVETGAPATTADTSGTDLGSDLRKRRGRRVSTNLGL